MTFSRRSLLALAFVTPGIANAALLQFDYEAPVGQFGVQPGSYFVVDTSIVANNGVFTNAIVDGELIANDPAEGVTVYGGGEPINLGASFDGSNTEWTVDVSDGTSSATMSMIFSDIDLSSDLVDDVSIYNAQFSSGAVLSGTFSMPMQNFNVSDITPTPTTPSPVPLPPTLYLMASSLFMLLWRGKFSFSNAKTKLLGAAA